VEDQTKVNEGIQRAVALMTAWNDTEDGEEDGGGGDPWFAVQLASQDLAEAVVDNRLLDESITLITGLMSLAGRLLIELERHTNTPIPTILQQAGVQHTGD
jgi:hypothetical protein